MPRFPGPQRGSCWAGWGLEKWTVGLGWVIPKETPSFCKSSAHSSASAALPSSPLHGCCVGKASFFRKLLQDQEA